MKKSGMSALQIIVTGLLILAAGAIAGAILLTLSFSVPVNSQSYSKSIEIMEKEGWYPTVPVLSYCRDEYFHSYLPGVLDNNSDSIMLYTAMDTSGDSLLYRAMDMYSEYLKQGYSYYWHGYVSILRPLLFFLDYGEIRILNGCLQLIMIVFLAQMVYRKKGVTYMLILLTSFLLLFPAALNYSLQFSWVFYIGAGGAMIVMKKQAYFEQIKHLCGLFLILGMLTSYFDLLTYPLFTWGGVIIWWVIASDDKKARESLKGVVLAGLSWIAGYGGLWIMKWCLGTLVLKRDVFGEALSEVIMRSDLEGGSIWNRFDAIFINWKHYEYKLFVFLFFLWILWAFYNSLRKRWQPTYRCLPLMLIAVSPFVWYFVLSNHTRGHHFFTYRVFNISILALLLIMAESLEHKKDVLYSLKKTVMVAGGWIAAALGAGLIAWFSREELFILNGSSDYQFAQLKQESVMEAVFTPTFSEIKEFALGLKTDHEKGFTKIVLYQLGEQDMEGPLYQLEIPAAETMDVNFYRIPVEWKLAAGEPYMIHVTAEDGNETAQVMITEPDEILLPEFSPVILDGNEMTGQPVFGVNYWKRPGKGTLLFYGITWMGIFISLEIVIIYFFGRKRKE